VGSFVEFAPPHLSLLAEGHCRRTQRSHGSAGRAAAAANRSASRLSAAPVARGSSQPCALGDALFWGPPTITSRPQQTITPLWAPKDFTYRSRSISGFGLRRVFHPPGFLARQSAHEIFRVFTPLIVRLVGTPGPRPPAATGARFPIIKMALRLPCCVAARQSRDGSRASEPPRPGKAERPLWPCWLLFAPCTPSASLHLAPVVPERLISRLAPRGTDSHSHEVGLGLAHDACLRCSRGPSWGGFW